MRITGLLSPCLNVRERVDLARRTGGIISATAVCCGVLALAGCTGGNQAVAAAVPTAPGANPLAVSQVGWPAAVPSDGLAQGLVLPLETYMETYPQQVAISRGVFTLESACMSRFGFTLPDPGLGQDPPPNNDASNMARRYGITDLAQARLYGYGLPGGSAGTEPGQPALPAAENYLIEGGSPSPDGGAPTLQPGDTSYHGLAIPAGGCIGQARRALNVIVNVDALPDRLDAASLDKSQVDPRVQAVLGKWSACMAQAGYKVDNPFDAPALVQTEPGKQTAIAVADVTCKQKTDLVQIWYGVDLAIQQQDVQQNQPALNQIRAAIQAEVKAANLAAG